MGVVAPTAVVAASGILQEPRAGALTTGPASVYSVKNDGGLSSNGTYDDQSIQRCVNLAAANYGGDIVVDVQVLLGTGWKAIRMPARGAYRVKGTGAPISGAAFNEHYPSNNPYPGIHITGGSGQQPAGIISGTQYIFDCITNAASISGQAAMSFAVEGLSVYDRAIANISGLMAVTQSPYIVHIVGNNCTNVGLLYMAGGGPSGQPTLWRVEGNVGSTVPAIISQSSMPFMAEISGNCWTEGGAGFLPSGIHGSFIHSEIYPIWQVHDNFLINQNGASTTNNQCAWIYYTNISETSSGSLHDNVYYGAEGACIYYKNNLTHSVANPTSGLHIHDEEFTAWNEGNPWPNGSALIIDTSSAGTPDQLVSIGKCTFQGGYFNTGPNNAKHGLEIVQNPDAANVVFDREQLIRDVTNAGYRINGVDYGATGNSHRFRATLATPAIPSSGRPFGNPFGFDSTVYVSGRNLNDVAIDGASTGLRSGMYSVPRGATITLTYSSPPTWKWFVA